MSDFEKFDMMNQPMPTPTPLLLPSSNGSGGRNSGVGRNPGANVVVGGEQQESQQQFKIYAYPEWDNLPPLQVHRPQKLWR